MAGRRCLLVLFQHGSHGNVRDFAIMRRCIEAAAADAGDALSVTIFETDVNARLKSDHGVERCTARLLKEFLPFYEAWAEKHAGAELRFSAVGHSFGGILLRRAIAAIVQHPVTRRRGVVPSVFATVATPHLGVRCSVNPVMLGGAWVVGQVYSQTYLDLLGASDVLGTTLLDAVHLDALKSFQRRVLFANVVNDHLVGFETASLAFDQVEAVTAERALPPSAATPHLLPKRRLPREVAAPVPPRTASKTWRNPTHWPALVASRATADTTHGPSQAMAATLRGAMDFDLYPVVQRSWLPTAHNSVMQAIPGLTQMRDVLEQVAAEVLLTAQEE